MCAINLIDEGAILIIGCHYTQQPRVLKIHVSVLYSKSDDERNVQYTPHLDPQGEPN
jgi:hypothetical protein